MTRRDRIRRLAGDGPVPWERELSGRCFASLVALPGGDVLWMTASSLPGGGSRELEALLVASHHHPLE